MKNRAIPVPPAGFGRPRNRRAARTAALFLLLLCCLLLKTPAAQAATTTTTAAGAAIRFDGVGKAFAGPGGTAVHALKDVTLEVAPGAALTAIVKSLSHGPEDVGTPAHPAEGTDA